MIETHIKRFYKLLEHEEETELRCFKLSEDLKSSVFVERMYIHSLEDFVSYVKRKNKDCNVYAGLQERTKGGSKAEHVKKIKKFFIDVDVRNKPSSVEDIQEAEKVTDTIIKDLEEKTKGRPTKIFTGNGFHLIYTIPEIEITDENRDEINQKIQMFERELIQKYSTEKVLLDNVGDLPRIIRVAGTRNHKGGKISLIREQYDEPNPELRKILLEQKNEVTQLTQLTQLTPENTLPKKETKDTSRSAKEYPEVIKLVSSGLSDDKIKEEMNLYSKWKESPEAYKNKTIEKAKKLLGDGSLKNWKREQITKKIREKNTEEEKEEFLRMREVFLAQITSKDTYEKSQATDEIVKYILKKYFIYSLRDDNKQEYWMYNEGVYIPNGASRVKEIVRKILGSLYNQYYANLILAKIQTETYIDAEEFFGINYIHEIPVKNGILNIKTKQLMPYTPKKIFFSKINAEYKPEAQCKKIDTFLSEILQKPEDKKIFYELVGFSLLKEYRWERSFMLVGNGRNGKGKSIELIKRLLGQSNCASIPLNTLSAESFRISELLHKLVNIAGDIGYKDLKDTSMFKSLTGRDLVGGQRKFLSDVHFENYAKMIFACNDLPMVYDISVGFWERWILLNYPYTFKSKEEYEKAEDKTNLRIKNTNIINEIVTEEEMSGLLNEGLKGLSRLIKNDSFSYTLGSAEVKDQWIRQANSFMAFAMDNIEDEYESFITKRELRKRYKDYCKKHKVKYVSDKQIFNVLTSHFGVSDERKTVGGWPNNKVENVWEGIKWKE